MKIINTYTIGFWSTGSELVSTLKVDAFGKKEAEDLGKELRDSLLPILQVHYEYLGLSGPTHLKIIIL